MTQTTATQRGKEEAPGRSAIRPFPKVNVPESELAELRRRINATRWPERETVADATQVVPGHPCVTRHFAAFEQPKLFSEELRAGFRSLR